VSDARTKYISPELLLGVAGAHDDPFHVGTCPVVALLCAIEESAMLESVLLLPLIVLFVRVCVEISPTKVSLESGKIQSLGVVR
jgi:hypothetical protein